MMINPDQSKEKRYSREETRTALGIKSRVTLNSYCNYLRIPAGVRYFTEAEYALILKLREWVLRGYRICDFPSSTGCETNCA
jgi:hypothetical protein